MEKLLRLSTTMIDKLHYFLNDDEKDMDSLLKDLQSSPDNELMARGRVFHSLVAMNETDLSKRTMNDAFLLDKIVYPQAAILAAKANVPKQAISEQKLRIRYKDSILTAVADYLYADKIIELKTCWSTFDYERYAKSLQWQIYLALFEAREVEYQVYELYAGAEGIKYKTCHTFSFSEHDLPSTWLMNVDRVRHFIVNNNLSQFFEVDLAELQNEIEGTI